MENLIINDQLLLERLDYSHVTAIYTAIDQNRNFLRKWLPFIDLTHSVADTERFVRSILSKSASVRDEIFVIRYKFEFAGLIGFKDIDRVNHKIEIGYWLIEKMTGKGIATICTTKMIKIAFKDMKMNRIQLRVGVGNHPSAAIPQRLGFIFEGVERSGEKHRGEYIDLEVYSLLKHEWTGQKK